MQLPILTVTRLTKRTDGLMQGAGSHWRCTLHYTTAKRSGQMTVTYSMGSAHTGGHKPMEPMEVLGSLFSDASYAGHSFADFCDGLGYDGDSIRALKTYKACQSISVRLHKLLGPDYEALRHYCEAAAR